MRNFIVNHERQVLRFFEILPGFFSWNMILLPYWGIFVFPNFVAYFVLLFNVYWFYQSFLIAITSIISHTKIQAAINYDWVSDLKTFPDWDKVHNVVIIPTYKEPLHILERTINSLINQTLPTEMISVILAMEEKEPKEDRNSKFQTLNSKYGKYFKNFIQTNHELVAGEVAGKASNEKYAAVWFKKNYIGKGKLDINYLTVTSCDADHKYHPNHFACLSFKFLDCPTRYRHFWQPAVMFYNNIWELPAITRVPNTFGSIWNLSQLPRKDRLINAQNYSLSYKLLDEVDYWDADKIPEDWGIFFKAYYKVKGGLEVEPIYLPLHADAAQSTTTWKTIKAQYEQYRRWAWGTSDDSWIIKNYLVDREIPFWDKTTRLGFVLWAHFMWPVNWFIITIGLTLPTLINPAFGRTALGFMVPKLSSIILTLSLGFLIVLFFINNIYKPKRPETVSIWRTILTPFEFILMPVVGFFFSALPGLDAHTRLMLGKYIEYKVTEKV
ncbi:MAG: glycosyltransferase family 2 protein [Candidatus Woesebacteria bacterium]|nr:glycosyltransferase family 2 protein [Candidatus Woesebacteria bacterium]